MLKGLSTFRSKVFFPILFLVLATVSSMGSLYVYTQNRLLEKELGKRGESLVTVLAKNLKVGLMTRSDEFIDEAITGALDIDDVMGVRVYGFDGKVLRSIDRKDHPPQDIEPKRELFDRNLSPRIFSHKGHVDLFAPVYYVESIIGKSDLDFYPVETGGKVLIGYVELSMSKEGIVSAGRTVRNLTLLTAFLFCFIGGLIAYYIASRVTLPLSDLVKNIREMEQRGLHRLPEHGDYEIRELSVAFNAMADTLKKREHELIEGMTEKKRLEEQLQQAQKMEAIGQLAGGIAHDFNNILSAITGYGHLLLMKMDGDGAQKDYVEHILEAAERAGEVTHSLLAFSRKQVINPKPLNVNNLIRKFEKLLLRVIGEDIALKTELADREIAIMADAGQLEQVVMNLVTNARDAMPGGGSLTLRTGLVELDDAFIEAHGYGNHGSYAFISVSDTGVGIDKETREKIFQPFFTTKVVGKGTGLGLAMVYGIVTQHQGYIMVESEPGKGTTFTVYLPAITPQEEALPTTADSPLRGGTETILVAEDDEKVRKLSDIVLREYGYEVILAEDGEDAVRKFIENMDRIQLVILDVIMPKKSGKEAYEEIKRLRHEARVLFSSGYTADRIDRGKMVEEGFDFIVKPAQPKDLLRKVREILDK